MSEKEKVYREALYSIFDFNEYADDDSGTDREFKKHALSTVRQALLIQGENVWLTGDQRKKLGAGR